MTARSINDIVPVVLVFFGTRILGEATAEFAPIAVPQEDFFSIDVGGDAVLCPDGSAQLTPISTIEATFTIKPSPDDTVSILTDPPNLMTASVTQGSVLTFVYNGENTSGSAGVQILVPPTKQITTVTAKSGGNVQVLSGTSVTIVNSVSGANLFATGAFNDIATSGGGRASIESTASAITINAGGGSNVQLKGAITSGFVDAGTQLSVEGTISGMTVSSGASVTSSTDCDGVNQVSGGSCSVNSNLVVAVEVLPETSTSPAFPRPCIESSPAPTPSSGSSPTPPVSTPSPTGGVCLDPTLNCVATGALAKISRGSLSEAEVCARDYSFTGQLIPYTCTSGAKHACCCEDSETITNPGQGLGTCTRSTGSGAASAFISSTMILCVSLLASLYGVFV